MERVARLWWLMSQDNERGVAKYVRLEYMTWGKIFVGCTWDERMTANVNDKRNSNAVR